MNEKQTKLLIIGSGPAGYTAAIYAVRAGLNPLMISGPQKGGQITLSQEIENFPGFPNISGNELMEKMHEQTIKLGVECIEDIITKVDFSKKPFICESEKGLTIETNCVIIATGATARFLKIPSEEKFIGFGVSTCATCDSFFYRGKDVAVIGGGNTAAIEALHLAKVANSVTIIHRREELRAEKTMQNRLFNEPKIRFEWNSTVEEFIGEENPTSLTGIKLKNVKTGLVNELKMDGVFLSIGHNPRTDIFKGQIDLNEEGYIKTHNGTCRTNIEGVFAAGDVQDPKYRQAILAAASGAQAALEADEFLTKLGG